jgi:hypothetical protein
MNMNRNHFIQTAAIAGTMLANKAGNLDAVIVAPTGCTPNIPMPA